MMDDLVLRGMAKWPDVPAVYGWLALDRRGCWRIRGERISNPLMIAFICRNYGCDDEGRWFLQNGPQRVFVALEYAPYVYRVVNADGAPLALETHCGKAVDTLGTAWLDETAVLLLETEHGIGLVRDLDLDRVLPFLGDADGSSFADDVLDALLRRLQRHETAPLWLAFGRVRVRVSPIHSNEVAHRFGFAPCPVQPEDEKPDC